MFNISGADRGAIFQPLKMKRLVWGLLWFALLSLRAVAGDIDLGNSASVAQTGERNKADILQEGTGNFTDLAQN